MCFFSALRGLLGLGLGKISNNTSFIAAFVSIAPFYDKEPSPACVAPQDLKKTKQKLQNFDIFFLVQNLYIFFQIFFVAPQDLKKKVVENFDIFFQLLCFFTYWS